MRNAEIYHAMPENGLTDIWLPEMEFLPPDQAEYRKSLWQDTLEMDELTVFAVDGYGDMFAWRPDDSVVFIETDTGTCTKYASCLPDAVFRRIIEFANGDYTEMCSDAYKAGLDADEAEDCISERDAVGLLKQYQSAFGNYFSQDKKEYIDSLIQHGFLPDCNAFLYEEQMISVIRDLLHVNTAESVSIRRKSC